MKRFKRLGGDINPAEYGGTWYRRAAKGRYHVIELINMLDACGDDSSGTYAVELSEIDVLGSPERVIQDAKNCCGYGGSEELILVDCLHSYGAKAPLWGDSGNNWKKLMTQARTESKNLDDPTAYEEAMRRPVNQLGSTAREFSRCDFDSAIRRGTAAGSETAALVDKIHGGVPPEPACGFSVNLRKVPADDPIAFVAGFSTGLSGGGLPMNRSDLAEAYIKGFQIGVEVRVGKIEKPEWVK